MPFETTITHRIMKYLNNTDRTIMEKVKGEAECSGRADINGCYHGRSVRIEVKTPDNRNKPSKKQLYNLWEWHKAGALVMVVYSVEAVERAFSLYDKLKDWNLYDIIKEPNGCKSFIVLPHDQEHCLPFSFFYNMYYG